MRKILMPALPRTDLARSRRNEKDSVEARDRRILEFPLSLIPNAVCESVGIRRVLYFWCYLPAHLFYGNGWAYLPDSSNR
jgi:hypothetical protein